MFLFLFFICFSFALTLQEPLLLFSVEDKVWYNTDFYEQVFKEDWEAMTQKKQKEVLEDFIAQELLVFLATQKGFHNTPNIKKDLEVRKKALLINNTYEHLIARPQVDSSLLSASLKNLKNKVEVSHLLIGFSGSEQDTKSLRSQKQALVLIDSLRAEIIKEVKKGKELKESFMDFAFEYSNDPSAKQNRGFIGWMPWGHAVFSFQVPVFNLKNNLLSKPLLTPFGYHLALKTSTSFSNYYYYTPKHYIDLAYKVSQNTLSFDTLKTLSSNFDSLLIKKANIVFNHPSVDSLVFFLETKKQKEKLLGNKNILIDWLEQFKKQQVLFISNKNGFGPLWLKNKLEQTPSSRVPSLKTKQDLQSLILSFVLQEEVLVLAEKNKIDTTASFMRDWSNNYSHIIYSEYLSFLNSKASNIDSISVEKKYNRGLYKDKYIKPKQAVFTEVRVFTDSLGFVLENQIEKGVLFDSLVVLYNGGIKAPISSGAKSPLGKALFKMSPGEISSIIKNSDGSFSVARLESFIEPEPFSLSKVYTQIEQELKKEKQDSVRQNLFKNISLELSPVINYNVVGLSYD